MMKEGLNSGERESYRDSAAAAGGTENPPISDPVTRRRFLRRTGGATAATVLALHGMRMDVWASPSSTVKWGMVCSAPVPNNSTDPGPGSGHPSGSPQESATTHVTTTSGTTAWTVDPLDSTQEYQYVTYAYLVANKVKDLAGVEPYNSDSPSFTGGGRIFRRYRDVDDGSGAPGPVNYSNWVPSGSGGAGGYFENDSSDDGDISNAAGLQCPTVTVGANVQCAEDDGAITSSEPAGQDNDGNSPQDGATTTINITAGGASVSASMSITTGSMGGSGELSDAISYTKKKKTPPVGQ